MPDITLEDLKQQQAELKAELQKAQEQMADAQANFFRIQGWMAGIDLLIKKAEKALSSPA